MTLHETTLHEQLDDLAAVAPVHGAPPRELWRRGRRRARLRRLAAAGAAAAVVLVVAATALVRVDRPVPAPADVPFDKLHLPERVNAPGAWSSEEGARGPLAAVGFGMRTTPEGWWTGSRQELQPYGVSAVDGLATWIDAPMTEADTFALSPDGRWIGWARHVAAPSGRQGRLIGWAVMNTVTREVRELADPAVPRPKDVYADLAFTGDSRYLLTSYGERGEPDSRNRRFVAWEVADGTPTVVEETGRYWLPNVGSAPAGVVWARKTTVFRADPVSGERASYEMSSDVMAASWGPDDVAFAYIGRPPGRSGRDSTLYAGRTLDEARDHALPLGDGLADQLLGWTDARHVVVGHYRTDVRVVDVVTGDVVEVDLDGYGRSFNAPLLAGDLWANDLRAPTAPHGTTDPRRPYRWGAGGVAVVGLAGLGLVLVRRRRARG